MTPTVTGGISKQDCCDHHTWHYTAAEHIMRLYGIRGRAEACHIANLIARTEWEWNHDPIAIKEHCATENT